MADGLEVGGPGGVLGVCLAVGVVAPVCKEFAGEGNVIHHSNLTNTPEFQAVDKV